ncbi:MAG: MFS transporter [bacterium]
MRQTSWQLGRLVAARAVRTFGYGALSVVLAVELSRRGLSALQVGLLFTAALWGGAAAGAGLPALLGHRLRVALMGCAAVLTASGAVVATTSDFRLLAAVFALGLVSPTGQDTAAFQALEQTALAADTPGSRHVRVYALYDFSAFVAAAAGGLAVAVLSTLARSQDPGTSPDAGVIWAFAALSAALLPLYAGVSDVPRPVAPARTRLGPSRRPVLALTALFGLDAFAGGFVVQSFVALWFHERFGLGAAALGLLFFGTNLLSGLSFLVAPFLVRRWGLLPTMVGTHLASNALLCAVPLLPTWEAAAVALLLRHLTSQVDVPVRRAYTMAAVLPEERPAAAGLTLAVRHMAAGLATPLAGWSFPLASGAAPFLVAGALKACYDVALWYAFRNYRLQVS